MNSHNISTDNSFDWSRCCIVDVKTLNQKIFALIAIFDAFLKNSFVENMKISIAMNISSLKCLMNMNDFAIETFDSDITLNAHSKNSSTQHIENSKTMKNISDSICIYELSALLVFDFNIVIDFEIYTVDTLIIFSRRKLQLSSFCDLALRNISFDWSRCCTNFIDSHISSISICTSITFDVISVSTVISIECVTIIASNTNFCEKEQLFCFTMNSSESNTNFYERKQSFCFLVDTICTFVAVANIDALTLTVDMIKKKKSALLSSFLISMLLLVWTSILSSVVNVTSKSKHKRLSKMKIKNY